MIKNSLSRFMSPKHLMSALFISALAVLINQGCTPKSDDTRELIRFPIDNMDNLIFQPGMSFDQTISSDGKGSLRIFTVDSTTFRLYETGKMDVENAHLTYQSKIKTQDLQGRIYLEMWCSFPGRGEFFSRDLQSPVSGTTDWITEATYFYLRKDEKPDNIKLNLVVAGRGTVWIDDIRVLRTPVRKIEGAKPK